MGCGASSGNARGDLQLTEINEVRYEKKKEKWSEENMSIGRVIFL